jgi:hypothetical protein
MTAFVIVVAGMLLLFAIPVVAMARLVSEVNASPRTADLRRVTRHAEFTTDELAALRFVHWQQIPESSSRSARRLVVTDSPEAAA